ncbi:hypothetical protein [Chromobacterium phragmitis]|uniref:GNAT family N-acetyltransferase n=1 Tax=Chromobacterium phragmitis TaxID=2202141 RepID=A0A344UD35_9NEIS|nr:hypothetical protein [Chromobacterium phragmitis]AXE33183.1 hypothetical protein DK843_01940 [Chromobacterium phragmitis]
MPLFPADFKPPRQVHFTDFQLDVLSPKHAQADYQAVLASADAIRHVFGPENHWPPTDIGFDENLSDLQRHFNKFERAVAFAYSLLSPDKQSYLGCLYIKPIKSRLEHDWRKQRFQAQAFLWLTVCDQPLREEQTLAALQGWLARDWPWLSISWPGREPSWEEWLSSQPNNDLRSLR